MLCSVEKLGEVWLLWELLSCLCTPQKWPREAQPHFKKSCDRLVGVHGMDMAEQAPSAVFHIELSSKHKMEFSMCSVCV